MNETPDEIRDLRIDLILRDGPNRYRVTHIPSGVHAESESLAEAAEMVNEGLDDEA